MQHEVFRVSSSMKSTRSPTRRSFRSLSSCRRLYPRSRETMRDVSRELDATVAALPNASQRPNVALDARGLAAVTLRRKKPANLPSSWSLLDAALRTRAHQLSCFFRWGSRDRRQSPSLPGPFFGSLSSLSAQACRNARTQRASETWKQCPRVRRGQLNFHTSIVTCASVIEARARSAIVPRRSSGTDVTEPAGIVSAAVRIRVGGTRSRILVHRRDAGARFRGTSVLRSGGPPDGPWLSGQALLRLACDAGIVVAKTAKDGSVLVGRKRGTILPSYFFRRDEFSGHVSDAFRSCRARGFVFTSLRAECCATAFLSSDHLS
jgi:hypothetical protein